MVELSELSYYRYCRITVCYLIGRRSGHRKMVELSPSVELGIRAAKKAVTKLEFTILIQKQKGDLLFSSLQNHLLLRKFAELKCWKTNGRFGFIDIVKLDDQKTVNSDWYTHNKMPSTSIKNQTNKQSRPSAQFRGVLLHQDNARPHTSAQTLYFFRQLWCPISHSSTILSKPSTL
ncbi:hypothetical protein LAZ67_1000171 [Cordylochernes scorpioides]|uniref:Transposase n=1 Tax=Cordylochernes scorpioides TaxID=51811 RepID=A0ABY6JUL4_9ARAC|nr:hypothetical protein LAZ67_1000171 [Cordylochernes scorpioides]